MLTFFKNLITSFTTASTTNTYSLNVYIKFYVFFYKTYNIDFIKYTQFLYLINRFTLVNNTFIYLFYYVFYSNKLNNLNEKYTSVVKKTAIIYVIESVKYSTAKLLSFLKHLPTNISTLTFSSKYVIRYSPTSVVKYLHNNYTNTLDILYLRKNKVFNKGRYSRNRQFYRTGVYWCLYINIIAIIGLYFWFYRFVMNFGYLWWLLFLSLASFVIAKTFNYKLYTPIRLINSISQDLIFFSLLIKNLISNLSILLWTLLKKLNTNEFFNLNNLINTYSISSLWFLTNFFNIFGLSKQIYIWGYNNENYYIHSVTQNFSKFVLNSKKNKLITEFIKMLLSK